MALSSDEIIKRECIDLVSLPNGINLRVFPESSNADQKPFSKGGLTFGIDGVYYGSCDACWYSSEEWIEGHSKIKYSKKPIIALEGTDALNRRSSGNAQYQRFHHVLGAVKNGVTGIYYLRKGDHKIQEDLFGMAYNASQIEKGKYLIIDDLKVVERLLAVYHDKKAFDGLVNMLLEEMKSKYVQKFNLLYGGDWERFAERRSSILTKSGVIKISGRMKRNFTDGSQRAGHIAVGEMFLTKYYFPKQEIYYLWPKMSAKDVHSLDATKARDKEWYLLRNEPSVTIVTRDNVKGLDEKTYRTLEEISSLPLVGDVLKTYNPIMKKLMSGFKDGSLTIQLEHK